jgi:hypothetical protein
VSGGDAYNGEMGFQRRLSTEQQERLLAGAPFADGGELDEMAAFARALPAFAREQASDVLTAALVPRLAAASRASAEGAGSPQAAIAPPPRRARSRRRMVARVAIAVALLPALFAGLAFAGVTLPEPAREAFERVGVDLPNQSAVEDEPAAAGDDARDVDDQDAGPASEKRKRGTEKDNPARARGRGNGTQGKGRALGKRGLAPGKTGSRGKSGSRGGGQDSGGGTSGGGSQGKANGQSGGSPPPQANKPVIPPGQAKLK